MKILLTNDDGIEAVGIQTLYDHLSEFADVTIVAPVEDQSAVGRQLSGSVKLHERETGYAVDGTPADCVIAALGSLDLNPDMVIAGVNEGANLGHYVLGRSGTVSAAVEATFFGVPAIAVSVYFPGTEFAFDEFEAKPMYFDEAARAVRYLVERAPDMGVFESADYLNVNAPLPPDDGSAPMEITHPSPVYEMDAERDGEMVHINDGIWEQMAAGNAPDTSGSDRRAVLEGRISVSPLTAPHTSTNNDTLTELARKY